MGPKPVLARVHSCLGLLLSFCNVSPARGGHKASLQPKGGLQLLQTDPSARFSLVAGLSHPNFATSFKDGPPSLGILLNVLR